MVYRWTHLNFTWYSQEHYNWAIHTGRYRPENNAPTGIKISFSKLYLTLPRLRNGIPATLAVLGKYLYKFQVTFKKKKIKIFIFGLTTLLNDLR